MTLLQQDLIAYFGSLHLARHFGFGCTGFISWAFISFSSTSFCIRNTEFTLYETSSNVLLVKQDFSSGAAVFPASRCICVLVSTFLAGNYCKWTNLSERQYFCTTCVPLYMCSELWGDTVTAIRSSKEFECVLRGSQTDRQSPASCPPLWFGMYRIWIMSFRTSHEPAKFCILSTDSTFMDHLHLYY